MSMCKENEISHVLYSMDLYCVAVWTCAGAHRGSHVAVQADIAALGAGVAKKAKQMLFGFTSMDYLKTHTISYSVQRGAYDEYFTKLTGQWNNTYSAEDETDDGSLTVATVVATAVMMAPLVLVGVKLGARLLK